MQIVNAVYKAYCAKKLALSLFTEMEETSLPSCGFINVSSQ